jgi:hypothetical protein
MSWKQSFVKVPNKRILLTEEDFTTLVSGNILVKEGVEVALQDVGFRRMKQIIDNQTGGNRITEAELQAMINIMSPSRHEMDERRNRDTLRGDDNTTRDIW